jgi:hypothetical protein
VLIIDAAVVAVALPAIQADLDLTPGQLQSNQPEGGSHEQ